MFRAIFFISLFLFVSGCATSKIANTKTAEFKVLKATVQEYHGGVEGSGIVMEYIVNINKQTKKELQFSQLILKDGSKIDLRLKRKTPDDSYVNYNEGDNMILVGSQKKVAPETVINYDENDNILTYIVDGVPMSKKIMEISELEVISLP